MGPGELDAVYDTITGNDVSLLIKALDFASRKHRNQRRKDSQASPYINHPIALTHVLCHEGGVEDVETLCAALLHDTVEDTHTTPEELAQHFGVRIRNIVMEVTDDTTLPKEERKRQQVINAARASDQAKLVKLADKICNIRDVAGHPPVGWGLERRQAYFDWAKRVIDEVRGVHAELESVFDQAYAARPKS